MIYRDDDMKKIALLLCFCVILTFLCKAQSLCESSYQTAMKFYEEKDYENALLFFNKVMADCGIYKDVESKKKDCESKINKKNSTLSIEKTDVLFGPQGGTEAVKVTSNTSWSFRKGADWLNLKKNKGQLVIECEGNATGEERNALITVVASDGSLSKSIQIIQSKSTLKVNATSISLPEDGCASYLVKVSSNDDWDVVSKETDWFSAKKREDGVLVSCDLNSTTSERNGSFVISTSNDSSVEIRVSQRKASPKIETESSIVVAWNAGDYTLTVDSNDPNWTAKVVSGSDWCKATKQNSRELLLSFQDNAKESSRTAIIRVSALGATYKDVEVRQRVYGYASLYEDYFEHVKGTKRITKYSASIYALGSYGLRVSALMYRWKVVEFDLLNLNMSLSKSFFLSWEPIVRGYLPLQRDGRCWKAYMGFGRCVAFVDSPLVEEKVRTHGKVLFEMGGECKLKWRGYDNISTRIFMRIDGYCSLGVALDMFKWK